MRYIYISLLTLFLVVFAVVVPSADAQTAVSNNTALEVQIAELMEQVATLQAQIKVLESTNVSLESEVGQLRLEARLRTGSTGEDVLLLQEFLATDPTIYPEGLITGFFGSLTENAVKRFQAKLKLEQVGVVGPQTLAKINEILVAAGVTGDIPSDFLGSRVKIKVKAENGELEIEVKCNSSGTGNVCKDDDEEDEDQLEIEVEIEEGKAHVDVEQDGNESRFVLNMTDRSAIITELSIRLGLSKPEIESIVEFEDDDEDNNEDDDEESEDEKDDDDDEDEEDEDDNDEESEDNDEDDQD